jgi:hypothetical protein
MKIRDQGRRVPARWSLAAILAGVLLIGACEGSNLFEGAVSEDPPSVTSLTAPTSVDAGALLTVQVTGTAARGVGAIEVRFTGAAVDTVAESFSGLNTAETMSASVTVSGGVGTTVTVRAFVSDINGTNSQFENRTVAVNATTPGAPQSN